MTKLTLDRLVPVEPDKEGCYNFEGSPYESIVEYIQTGILDFCGCGSPEENLRFIRDGLSYINHKGQPIPAWDAPEHRRYWDKYHEDGKLLFGNDRSQQFFAYWLDAEGLTEHGGSIPGWLTAEGKTLLELLNKADLDNDNTTHSR